MSLRMSGRRARQIEEGKREGKKWESMVAEISVRERLLKSHESLVQFLDLVARKFKPYEGSGWTVFCDWIYDAHRTKRSPELVEGFVQHPPHIISERVFNIK